MNPLEGVLYGLSVATTPTNLLAAFLGALLGTAVGVLPGLGPVAGAALILPLTYGLPPVTGVIALAGIYYGALYGGSTTSILVNIPGETASIITCVEGYEMTKKGRAGAALTVVAVGSFVAGTIGIVGVTFLSPLVASLALSFGSPEFFALTSVGLIVLSRATGGSLARSLFVTALGLMLATVGMEMITATRRFTFGIMELTLGIELVPAAVGLYGIAELFFVIEKLTTSPKVTPVKLRELFPTREEWRRSVAPWLRGTVLGFFLGLLPGSMAAISSFGSYRLEKAVSKRKEEFGHGAIEGVAGPEAANNAVSSSAFMPLLSLGLPFSPALTLVLAALLIQGVQPGPLLVTQHPEIFWGVIVSMYFGNVMLLVLNLPLVGLWVSLLRIPTHILIIYIVIFSVIGFYSVRNTVFDLWVLLAFGIFGYLFRKLHFDMAPMVLALVLGPLIEKYFRESLVLGRGDPTFFVTRPISLAIWTVGLLLVLAGGLLGRTSKAMEETALVQETPGGQG